MTRHARACRGHPRLCGPAASEVVDGRDKPGHDDEKSSRDLPGGAVLGVLEHDAHLGKLVADAIGFFKIFGLPSGSALRNLFFNLLSKILFEISHFSAGSIPHEHHARVVNLNQETCVRQRVVKAIGNL
jgi:hypothetical protein